MEKLYEELQTKYQFSLHLKKEQCKILQMLLQKKDAFVVWPTGFGKSILFMATPLLLDRSGFYLLLPVSYTDGNRGHWSRLAFTV